MKSIVLEIKCDRCGEINRVGTNIHDEWVKARFVQWQFSKDWFDGRRWLDEDLCPDCLFKMESED